MERKRMQPDLDRIPAVFHPLLAGAEVYDSSCSPEARVIYIGKEQGYFLKSAPKDTLQKEADLTRFFHEKGFAAQVLSYISGEKDWLLTQRVPGEDCIHQMYLEDPKRLCDTVAELLRKLHEVPHAGCPVPNRTEEYLLTAQRNFRTGNYDTSAFPDSFGYTCAEEAWEVVKNNAHLLKADTLLHGDYCLPNIILDNWRFSGFIDLGGGGVGDKHIDLFWGIWTLFFNLKTNAYRDRFLDAYGRRDVEPEMLRVIAAIEVFG